MSPDEFTNQEFFLDVGDGHRLYVQDWGNAKAKIPIIFLHGGPGAGVTDSHKQLYDPAQQRVIFFDQRGAGKSIVSDLLDHNTAKDLVSDINKITAALQIDRFILHGRSWGSCLSLYYAILHPERVVTVITGGIFLGTKLEHEMDERGERYDTFHPEAWQKFLRNTPKAEHARAIRYHLRQILNDDEETAKKSAYIYSQLVLQVLRLDDRPRNASYDDLNMNNFRVEAHFKLNDCFIPDGFILKNAAKLTMPVWIIQGRYDIMCTPEIAYKLHSALPNSQLIWVTAGHSGSDRAIYDASRPVLLALSGAQ